MAPLTTEMTICRHYCLKDDSGELLNPRTNFFTDNPALFPANFLQGVPQARTGLQKAVTNCLQVQPPSPSCSSPENFTTVETFPGSLLHSLTLNTFETFSPLFQFIADKSKSYIGKFIHPEWPQKFYFHEKPGQEAPVSGHGSMKNCSLHTHCRDTGFLKYLLAYKLFSILSYTKIIFPFSASKAVHLRD